MLFFLSSIMVEAVSIFLSLGMEHPRSPEDVNVLN